MCFIVVNGHFKQNVVNERWKKMMAEEDDYKGRLGKNLTCYDTMRNYRRWNKMFALGHSKRRKPLLNTC